MALLMYVLSVGPVAGYYSRVYYGASELPPSFDYVGTFYYPLECLSETPLGAPLQFYVGLWKKE